MMRLPEKAIIGVGVGVSVGVLTAWWLWRRKRCSVVPTLPPNASWEEVGIVSDLIIYPLKSALGVTVREAEANEYGLANGNLQDRTLVVVTKEEGRTVFAAHSGKLGTITVKVEGNTVILDAEGEKSIKVDLQDATREALVINTKILGREMPGVDCGEKVGSWLSKVLFKSETEVRLLYVGHVAQNRPAKRLEYFNTIRDSDLTYYSNNTSYNIASQTSLDDLNTRLEEPVTMANFRPNIVVSGAVPYDEDDWIYVRIGQVVLRRIKPCDRCIQTTINRNTGDRHPQQEPMTTLKTYHKLTDPPQLAKVWAAKPLFGLNLAIDVLGTVAVGEKVEVLRASSYPNLRGY